METNGSRTNGAVSRSRGQVIVMVVIALVVLVTIVGLANDIGFAWRAKLNMQSAADAGAMAAADALFMGGGVSPTTAAQSATTQNGFSNGSGTTNNSNQVTVTVNNPPSSGSNSGNSNAVEVIVQQAQPTYFLAVSGFSSLNVSARSVALVNSSSNCMYSLSPSASSALALAANSSVSSSCGIVLDSSSSQALTGGSNTSISAPSLGIVGGKSFGGSLPGNTTTGAAVVSDPLSYLPTPSVSGGCTTWPSVGPNATANIPSGYYCGLTVLSNSTVNLTSTGTYSFNGTINLGSNTSLNGTGVTLYFKTGSISMSSNTVLNLSAPTSGTYSGIVIFQDRSNSTTLALSSNSGMTLTGAVYAPDANVTLASNAFTNVYSIFVASTISISSNSTVNINANYSGLANGSPIKAAVAVE